MPIIVPPPFHYWLSIMLSGQRVLIVIALVRCGVAAVGGAEDNGYDLHEQHIQRRDDISASSTASTNPEYQTVDIPDDDESPRSEADPLDQEVESGDVPGTEQESARGWGVFTGISRWLKDTLDDSIDDFEIDSFSDISDEEPSPSRRAGRGWHSPLDAPVPQSMPRVLVANKQIDWSLFGVSEISPVSSFREPYFNEWQRSTVDSTTGDQVVVPSKSRLRDMGGALWRTVKRIILNDQDVPNIDVERGYVPPGREKGAAAGFSSLLAYDDSSSESGGMDDDEYLSLRGSASSGTSSSISDDNTSVSRTTENPAGQITEAVSSDGEGTLLFFFVTTSFWKITD
uniref:Uncharacterized protein n=1 Tax=Spongospora subterranea TaxID=70186 RepID=A0A0H5QI62_9EUKA|eukprot:CRZ01683.1 hypothetical protein [Spongospora subterranea]